ncbi:MAG: response regulator [Deltaproteobacteria bacterium]|nr:response regulator [Deltaproteobacteria bacterium]
MRVLIVDDSSTMRKVIASYVREIGIEASDEAEDGEEALGLLAQKRYRCVFLDLTLPGMSGIAVLRALRASGNQVPVVIVSGDTTMQNMMSAIEAGANDFLVKPFDKETLLRKARRVMGMQ